MERKDVIAGLRELADYLEANPSIKVPVVAATVYGMDRDTFIALSDDPSYVTTRCGPAHLQSAKAFTGGVKLEAIFPNEKLISAMKAPSVEEILRQAKQQQ